MKARIRQAEFDIEKDLTCAACHSRFQSPASLTYHINRCPRVLALRTAKPVVPLTRVMSDVELDALETRSFGRMCGNGTTGKTMKLGHWEEVRSWE